MFVDRYSIECKAGDGGHGCVSFRREAHIAYGGPNGGDGGHGGDVIVIADENVSSLTNLVGHKRMQADRGMNGQGTLKTGKSGEHLVIRVPPGTLVRDAATQEILADLDHHEAQYLVAKGGNGGRGNKRFATSTNRAPREFERGELGESRSIMLDLKLIADVGLIGKPNAGKSTLLSRLTRATPEIADYPFTTKYPNLGVVRIGYDRQFVLADIPGLIEGAHAGIGLGHEFLRHVERTKILVHLIEPIPADQSDPLTNYRSIREELRLYDETLAERPELVVVTKCELSESGPIAEQLEAEIGHPVLRLSAVTGKGLPDLVNQVFDILREIKDASLREIKDASLVAATSEGEET